MFLNTLARFIALSVIVFFLGATSVRGQMAAIAPNLAMILILILVFHLAKRSAYKRK